MEYKYLYGPVQSRRLGQSLGVDMIPFKTCNLNCIYCECGPTEATSDKRSEYVAAADIIAELDHYLANSPALDSITFGGSGEPTLNSGLGKVHQHVKQKYPQYSTTLLTNGTLLHLAEVREDLASFDRVLPSLDAISQEVFEKINAPCPGSDNSRIIEGLVTFASRYTGALWLEVFIVEGINDTPDELAKFKDALTLIKPSRVQLNSLDRPGTCDWVKPASPQRLKEIADYLMPLPVEIISRATPTTTLSERELANLSGYITATLARRPLTIEEIAVAAHKRVDELMPLINSLAEKKSIELKRVGGNVFCRKI